MDWDLVLMFSQPHERLAIGWEVLPITKKEPFTTIRVFLVFMTFELNIYSQDA